MIHCIRGEQISHPQIRQTFVPLCEKVEAQHGRIPLDPAFLAAIGHRFIAKNLKRRRVGLRRLARGGPETGDFFWHNQYCLLSFKQRNNIQ